MDINVRADANAGRIMFNVTDGDAVDNGLELVLNGTLEEGTESLTLDDLTVPRSYIDYLNNTRFADCSNIRLFLLAQYPCPFAEKRAGLLGSAS